MNSEHDKFPQHLCKRSLDFLAWAAFAVGCAALAFDFLYCLINASGHSAFDPRDGSLHFLPIVIFGLIVLWVIRSAGAWFASAIGLLGFGFGFYCHYTGVMREYEIWAEGGLRDPGFERVPFLFAYMSVTFLSLLVLFILKSPPGFRRSLFGSCS